MTFIDEMILGIVTSMLYPIIRLIYFQTMMNPTFKVIVIDRVVSEGREQDVSLRHAIALFAPPSCSGRSSWASI
jgi:cystathionine beta-lyase/cystathionine gamma-synthase